jgi:hypothetical protein
MKKTKATPKKRTPHQRWLSAQYGAIQTADQLVKALERAADQDVSLGNDHPEWFRIIKRYWWHRSRAWAAVAGPAGRKAMAAKRGRGGR